MKEIVNLSNDKKQEEKGLQYIEIFRRDGKPNNEYRFNRGLPIETPERLAEVRKQLIEESRKANLGKKFKTGGMWL